MVLSAMKKLTENFHGQQVNSLKNEMFLVRGYQFVDAPYAIIDDLPDEEAKRISEEAFPGKRNHDYIDVRRKVTSWLRTEAEKIGVRIDKQNPVSFAVVLGEDNLNEILKMLGPQDNMLVFRFNDVDLTNWSFTVDDAFIGAPKELKGSYSDVGHPKDPLHGRILDSEELIHHLLMGHRLEGKANDADRYYEAQLWGDEPRLLQNSAKPLIHNGFEP